MISEEILRTELQSTYMHQAAHSVGRNISAAVQHIGWLAKPCSNGFSQKAWFAPFGAQSFLLGSIQFKGRKKS